MNFLALLGWSFDDRTTIMSRDELIERFSLERVGSSPATFDYEKLDWMNGVYLRAMSVDKYADTLVAYLREQGYDWDEQLVRRAAPHVQEKIETLGQFPGFVGFLFGPVEPDPALLAGAESVLRAAHEALAEVEPDVPREVVSAARDVLAGVEPFTAPRIEQALRALVERLGSKPRDVFQPIRIAVTGSKISPGLFESLELLGKDESLARLAAAADQGR